ncbi:hypothetical protein ES703_00102 [subsurface metagenome]
MPREKPLTLTKDHINVPITIKISAAQKKKLDELATQLHRSQSELVREAIMALLGVYYAKIRSEDALAKAVDEGVARGKH